MNREFFEEINNKMKAGKKITKAELKLSSAYSYAKAYDCNWIEVDSISDLEPLDLARTMRNADIKEIYITGQWSRQFETWYQLQEAGLKMYGIRKFDNPLFIRDIKQNGVSWYDENKIAIVFELAENE